MINFIKEKEKKEEECSIGCTVMKKMGSEARLSGFEFQLCFLVAG